MDGPRDYLTMWRKSDREGQVPHDTTFFRCDIYKLIQMNLFTNQKETQADRKQTYLPKGEGWKDKLEIRN